MAEEKRTFEATIQGLEGARLQSRPPRSSGPAKGKEDDSVTVPPIELNVPRDLVVRLIGLLKER